MIRKLRSGSAGSIRAIPIPGRETVGAFESREKAEKHEREVQYFKRH